MRAARWATIIRSLGAGRSTAGRSWYTGLGHRPELFLDPVFLAHLEKGLLFATFRSEEC